MSIRHVRAVQKHSKIGDDTARHVLEIIALDIGHDDSPAFTSNRKIGKRARQSLRTVREAIETCTNSGELVAHKDGKYMFYKLNADLLPYGRTRDNEPSENDEKEADNPLVTMSDLMSMEQRLLQELIQNTRGDENNKPGSIPVTISDLIDSEQRLIQELIQKLFPLIQNTRGDENLSKVSNNKVSNKTPPNPPSLGNDWGKTGQVMFFYCEKTGRQIPDVNDRQKLERWMVGANELLGQCGDDVTKTCELVTATIAHMEQAGLNHSSPASLVNVAKQVQRDASTQASANDAENAWANVMGNIVGLGHRRFKEWNLTDTERTAFVKAAVQNGGISDACTVPTGVLNTHVKGAFIQAYNNGQNNDR